MRLFVGRVLFFVPALVLALAGTTAVADDVSQVLSRKLLDEDVVKRTVEELVVPRISKLAFSDSKSEFVAEAEALRGRVLDEVIFRGWPDAWRKHETRARWLEDQTIERGAGESGAGYRIRKLRYEPFPGLWIPALLYEPTELSGSVPVVLNVHGHERKLGMAAPYKQARCINLAKRGFLALSLEWYATGELPRSDYEHNQICLFDVCGRSGIGLFYVALRGGLDVLLAHPNADPNRTAVTGLSGGGWQTILHASLDERVRACAPNAGYIGLRPRVENTSDLGDLEQNPTDLSAIADYPLLTALIIPRSALLIYNERDNCCFASHRARPSVYDPVRPLYARHAPWAEFSYYENVFPGTHNYERDNRQAFYRFLNRQFLLPRERIDEEIDSAAEILPQEKLSVGLPPGNETFASIARRLVRRIEKLRPPNSAMSREEMLEELREVLRLRPAKVQSAKAAGRGFVLSLDTGWTLPVVEVGPRARDAGETVILVGDGGKAAQVEWAKKEIARGARVVAMDFLFHGECRAQRPTRWQTAMMLATIGLRAVGEQVAQVLAVADWAKARHGSKVTLRGTGRVGPVVVRLAQAIDASRDAKISSVAKVESVPAAPVLRQLVTRNVDYWRIPELYAFGLLPLVHEPTFENP